MISTINTAAAAGFDTAHTVGKASSAFGVRRSALA
ncbi:hypothetical protein SRABI121_01999 [Microbacterium sp. Bi121]|nr:hypothetical protein SRABI121_01999 [Microbacterium sp. Bi121]